LDIRIPKGTGDRIDSGYLKRLCECLDIKLEIKEF
jgi:hypothetical protein